MPNRAAVCASTLKEDGWEKLIIGLTIVFH
jgi:hypothetical protein